MSLSVNIRNCRQIFQPILLLTLFLLIPFMAEAQNYDEEISRITSGMPHGDNEVRGSWLYSNALRIVDGRLAFELMSLITSEYGGDAGVMASLWKVRYLMAANEIESARVELSALPELSSSATWEPEARYWRLLLTGEGGPDPNRREAGVPPWTVMTHLSAIDIRNQSSSSARRALALESVVDRWGLLGPWLWRLAHTTQHNLKQVALEHYANSRARLSTAPGSFDICRMLDIDQWNETPLESFTVDQTKPKQITQALQKINRPFEPPPAVIADNELLSPRDPETLQSEYAVQVGAFLNGNVARTLVRDLQSRGFTAYWREPDVDDSFYRVRIGPSKTVSHAESLGLTLSKVLMLPYQIVEEKPKTPADSSATDPFQTPVLEDL